MISYAVYINLLDLCDNDLLDISKILMNANFYIELMQSSLVDAQSFLIEKENSAPQGRKFTLKRKVYARVETLPLDEEVS